MGAGSQYDKAQLYKKVKYIYFCFFAMAIAERFSMSITYGAALYISSSALFRMFGFSFKTAYDSRLLTGIKTAVIVFFLMSTAYIVVLCPLILAGSYSVYAIVMILLLFIEREAEDILLRRRAKNSVLSNREITKTIVPVETAYIIAASLLAYFADVDTLGLVLGGSMIGMLFRFSGQISFHSYMDEYARPGSADYDLKQVRSARLYEGMVITSLSALNIFAFTYIIYFVLSKSGQSFFDFFFIFLILSLVFVSVYLGIYRVIKSTLIQRVGKNAAYILGTGVCIFAVYVFRDSWVKSPFALLVQALLLMCGLMLQMTATLGLKEDVSLVVKMNNRDFDDHALSARTARLGHWATVISEAVILAVLLILISNPLYRLTDVKDYIVYAPYVGSSVIAIPTLFLFISLFYSIKQPLTKKFGRKLKAYSEIKRQGNENPDMEKRLSNVLIRKYKKRFGVYIIRAFLKPVMYHTVTGQQNVTDLPGVFVFNHAEIYGPIAAIVFLPYDTRPWILDKMIDKKEIARHMYEGTFSRVKWLPRVCGRLIVKIISPVIVWALNSFEPIPVYRDRPRNVIKTFSLSITCLNAGDSIMLFPENPEDTYQEEVSTFYTGFAHLGKLYFKRTGKRLMFYPVFASKRSRVLRIGKGVQYDPQNTADKERIVKTLETRMHDLQNMDNK